MARKNKAPRKLWVDIKFKYLRGRPTPQDVQKLRTELIDSINRGDYIYSPDWFVSIEWRNREFDDMKRGEFTQEMWRSRQSSSGWDMAILNYLKGK